MKVQHVESLLIKLFTEFAVLIVRNRIYNPLNEIMLRLENRPNYMTIPATLRGLEKIKMVRRNNGRYRLDHAVSKGPKINLSSFDLNGDDIRTIADEIGTLRENNKS